MNSSDVAKLLSRLTKQGLPLSNSDGLQAVEDYFGNRKTEDSDSDLEGEESNGAQLAEASEMADVTEDTSGPGTGDTADVVTVEFGNVQHLFKDLLDQDETVTVSKFIESGCGCTKGPSGESCLKQFDLADVLEYRLSCFELDYMSENENRLNSMIVSQLCALLHRDDQLMCSVNRYSSIPSLTEQYYC